MIYVGNNNPALQDITDEKNWGKRFFFSNLFPVPLDMRVANSK